MLIQARRKAPGMPLVEADALALPFADRSFDLVTVAFGLRNLPDYAAGLREIRRILRPAGKLAVLEFSVPPGTWFRRVYHLYLMRLVPAVGRGLARRGSPYRYLSDSVRDFPGQAELARLMQDCGFQGVSWTDLTRGIVAVHVASAPDRPAI